MSADQAPASARPARPGEPALTLGVFAAVMAALLPVLWVVVGGWWLVAAIAVCALVLLAGYLARRARLAAIAVTLIEAAVWALLLTGIFFRDSALLWVLPTPQTFDDAGMAWTTALTEIQLGRAPMPVSASFAFLIAGATGLLTIVVDHVVLTARMPLLAAVGLIAVSLIPAIVVPREADVIGFVLLAVAILFLLRAETKGRRTDAAPRAPDQPGVPATAVGIGAVAVIVAVAVAPLLPEPVASSQPAALGGPGINADLSLGRDLRQPYETEVIRLHTTAKNPPYLRVTTLTEFDGKVWKPDSMHSVALGAEHAFGTLNADPSISTVDTRTTVQVQELATRWLPTAYPAVAVEGADGVWEAVPYNRTVRSSTASSRGQEYNVDTVVPQPTLEQIRAVEAQNPLLLRDTKEVPEGTPAVIEQTARAVTADADNDYDALIALQTWFRGSDFRYSLDAPVEDGFDGEGVQAVARFLEVREGYCVHFAAAFALMARTLDMPSRIVVGYLPGTSTGDKVGDEPVFSVMSSQLHAWPEVYFDRIGWVAFEPTKGLGVPTSFASTPTDGPRATPGATPTPSQSASLSPQELDRLEREREEASGSTRVDTVNPWPGIGLVAGVLAVLFAPALAGAARRRMLRARVDAHDAGAAAAAWLFGQEAAIDLGIAMPWSQSPRVFGERLIAAGAPRGAMSRLVVAIEQASYAPTAAQATVTAADAGTVRRGLLASAPPWRRTIAWFAPRSLLIRPGSPFAAAGLPWAREPVPT
ncbi:transglutaminaseTgpA domain-containing protein [Microbacterium fluvii]|uniref:TransglutaminaseTgpA domain-containing protein n=1 Tax=Microbacterium fluvii TaxID=415215 RepID=A0ABW2HB10_9MICO|nr:DUF3488 and transglutaminase-like domain-containing protein [Microbacterium fluvii]MCU4671679.1 DUF3488 and transglutaminase-like domain-containing protein [Microbacterium fluvii]